MQFETPVFIGVDVGTGGVRALAVSAVGKVLARAAVRFEDAAAVSAEGIHEQSPAAWWAAVRSALASLAAAMRNGGLRPEALAGLAVDGTSGTVVPLDASGEPLRAGIMYNDARASAEAAEINTLAGGFCDRLGYWFNASFGLAKVLWFQRHEPGLFARCRHLVHQADYVAGRLTGQIGVSDYSNCLKTGYDLLEEAWPGWMEALPDIRERLPPVVAPGTVVGSLSPGAAEATGLPAGLSVVAGASDGTAGFLASGAVRPGDYNTTLGTTLVFKGISRDLCRHPEGLIYCHKLPGGRWLPGAASNTGCEWISAWFGGDDPAVMDAAAAGRLPCDTVAYPLARKGERFPFMAPDAEGFCVPAPASRQDRYAACLQGTAFVERLAYDVLDRVVGTSGGEVYSTGGGTASDVWVQCRADATGRRIHRPACPESAFGSAVLAAAGTQRMGVWEAVCRMVRIAKTFEPRSEQARRCEEAHGRFRAELEQRGYV